MKKNKDSRLKTSYLSIKEYALYFFLLAAFNGFHMWIYQEMEKQGMFEANVRTAINLMILYVIIITFIVTVIIGFLRNRFMVNPIRKLSEAARKIAMGDFSVRIAPRHKDDKKDFVDVMFDDFNTMAEELASIETLKNDFIANVSHEIKTPLSVIQSYTTALQNSGLQEKERAEYTQTILEATQKLSVLVTNILKLNKLENQEIMGETKPYNLTEQIRRCVLAFVDLLEQKNIRFEEDLDEVNVCYDPYLLEIVWNNLLSNAVKFTDPGGRIFISLKVVKDSAHEFLQISVTDNGCGIDKDTQKRIFDKFYQGDMSHAKEGNGLGLALVKKTTDLLGGTVAVDSTLGYGSTFTVCLEI